jgi:predicted HNH restriction endonuclease
MKLGFLEKAMVLFVLGLVVLFVFATPAQKQLKEDQLDFTVLESDALYFKNLRQYYYVKRTREDAKFDLFCLKSTSDASSQKMANFMIISNWLNDMAYVKLLVDSNKIVSYRMVITAGADTFNIASMNMEEHQYLASKVYASFASEEGKYILLSEQEELVEVWKTHEERKRIKRILQDYFKLVGAL